MKKTLSDTPSAARFGEVCRRYGLRHAHLESTNGRGLVHWLRLQAGSTPAFPSGKNRRRVVVNMISMTCETCPGRDKMLSNLKREELNHVGR